MTIHKCFHSTEDIQAATIVHVTILIKDDFQNGLSGKNGRIHVWKVRGYSEGD